MIIVAFSVGPCLIVPPFNVLQYRVPNEIQTFDCDNQIAEKAESATSSILKVATLKKTK